MGLTDQGLHPEIYDDYRVETVDPSWLQERVKPKRHIGLTPELCILCRACEDVCPWECIFMMSPDIVTDAENAEVKTLADTAAAIFVVDDNERSEEHTSELQSRGHLVCRLLLEIQKRQPDR